MGKAAKEFLQAEEYPDFLDFNCKPYKPNERLEDHNKLADPDLISLLKF